MGANSSRSKNVSPSSSSRPSVGSGSSLRRSSSSRPSVGSGSSLRRSSSSRPSRLSISSSSLGDSSSPRPLYPSSLGDSSSPRPLYPSSVDLSIPKICAIFTSCTVHPVYIFDSNIDRAADDVDIVYSGYIDPYTYSQQFVQRQPNLEFEYLSPYHCFCGIGTKIYIFEGINQDMLGPPYYGKDEYYLFLIGVYRFDLLPEHLTRQSVTPPKFNKTHMDEVYEMQGRKCSPQAIQFGTNQILVFSTQFFFVENILDITDDSLRLVDFELYNIVSNDSVKLPSLHVYRQRQDPTFFGLIDGNENMVGFTPTENIEGNVRTGFRRTFSIMAFTLIHGHMFVVQPDFGGIEFCLDISSEEPKWELWRGTFSSCRGQHLWSRNGHLIFNSYGAYEVGSVDVFPFPLCPSLSSSIYGNNSLIALLEHTPEYVVCIMQMGQDYEGRLYWTMDMIKLDDEEFRFRNLEGRFATGMKSFKFVDHSISFPTTISALFPL